MRADLGGDPVERTDHGAHDPGRDTGVERGVVELGMAERSRAIMLAFYVIETEWSAERDLMLAIVAMRSERHTQPRPPP